MDIAGRFGENLAPLRKRAGLSQEAASFRAGLHRTEVSSLERGKRLPRVDTVAKLAGAVKADPGELFEGIAWQPGSVRYGQFKPDSDATL